MERHADQPTDDHDDKRATAPPGEQSEDAGSQGNPEVDEEALAQRQQERARDES
jgi:hypothetical protein